MAEGWKCPVCSRGVRPDKDTCDHGGLGALPANPFHPVYISPPGTPLPRADWGPLTRPITTCAGVSYPHDPNIMMWN